MKNPIKHPLFLIALCIYILLFALKKSAIYLPFVSDYLADFLAMPVVLSISLFGIRASKPERRTWKYHWGHILFAVVLFSVLFEVVYPRLTDRFTADAWDVLAYAAGGMVFWIWMNGRTADLS